MKLFLLNKFVAIIILQAVSKEKYDKNLTIS